MALFRCVLALAIASIITGCTSDVDTNSPAFRIVVDHQDVQTEAELIRQVGPATTESRVGDDGGFSGLCRQPAERVLSYEVKMKGLTKVFQDAFNLSTGQFTIVCVDKDRRITEITSVIVD